MVVCFACWITVVSGVVICRYYFCFVFCTCGVCVVWCLFAYIYLAFGLGASIWLPFVDRVCGGCSLFLLAGLWMFCVIFRFFLGGLLFSPLIWAGLWVFLVFLVSFGFGFVSDRSGCLVGFCVWVWWGYVLENS